MGLVLYKILQNLDCGYGIVLLLVAATLTVFGGCPHGGVARLPVKGSPERVVV